MMVCNNVGYQSIRQSCLISGYTRCCPVFFPGRCIVWDSECLQDDKQAVLQYVLLTMHIVVYSAFNNSNNAREMPTDRGRGRVLWKESHTPHAHQHHRGPALRARHYCSTCLMSAHRGSSGEVMREIY